MARIKQRQVLPCVDKQRSAAVKVKASEALVVNDLIMATGVSGAHMTAHKADIDTFTTLGGSLWVADYAVDSGTIASCAVPWKLLTSIDTATLGTAVGQPVYLSDTAGGYLITPPVGLKPHIKVGHIVKVHATDGAILLNPGAFSGQLGGQLTFDGSTVTATLAVGAAFDGCPVLATLQNSGSGNAYIKSAIVAGGTLTITANATTAGGIVTYLIIG